MHFSAPGQRKEKKKNNERIIIKDFVKGLVKKGILNHIKMPFKTVSMEIFSLLLIYIKFTFLNDISISKIFQVYSFTLDEVFLMDYK